MTKPRPRDAKLPPRISLHSFRVAVATDLLRQDVPLEQVQYLLEDVVKVAECRPKYGRLETAGKKEVAMLASIT